MAWSILIEGADALSVLAFAGPIGLGWANERDALGATETCVPSVLILVIGSH